MSSLQPAQTSLERIRISCAILWYKSAGNDQWVKLDGTQSGTFNVFNVEIRYSIKVEQRYPSGTGICSLVLEPTNYSEPNVDTATLLPHLQTSLIRLWVSVLPKKNSLGLEVACLAFLRTCSL